MNMFLVILITLLPCVNAFPQSKDDVSFRFSGGAAIPSSPDYFSDNWKTGQNFTFDFKYGRLLGSFHYNIYPFDKSYLEKNYSNIQGNTSVLWGITGGYTVDVIKDIYYVRVDFGYFNFSIGDVIFNQDITTTVEEFQSKTGFLIGVGIGLKTKIYDRLSIFIEPHGYLGMSSDDKNTGQTIFYSSGGSTAQKETTQAFAIKVGFSYNL